MNFAKETCGKHKSFVHNCIAVKPIPHGVMRKKNCTFTIMAMKDGDCGVEDRNKTEIFIFLSSCGNLANSYLL